MSGRTAIIHIGTPKTGTTSIQQLLKRNRAELVRQHVSFPKSPGASVHGMLSTACAGGPYRPADRVWEGVEPTEKLAQFNRAFAAEMQQLPARIQRVIFSDERLCVALHTHTQIERLRALMQPHFSNIIIVIYLRRQDQLLASSYSQMLRHGIVHAPGATFDTAGNYHYFDYHAMLQKWADLFGQAAIKPRIYEHTASGPFDSVADFSALCGISLPQGESARPSTLNTSISVVGQTILREVGAILQRQTGRENVGSPAWRAISAAVSKSHPGRGWSPSAEESHAFMQRFNAGNEALRQIYHPDRATLFSNQVSKPEATSQPPSDAALFTGACQALVESMNVRINREKMAARQARRLAAGDPPDPQPAEEDAENHTIEDDGEPDQGE